MLVQGKYQTGSEEAVSQDQAFAADQNRKIAPLPSRNGHHEKSQPDTGRDPPLKLPKVSVVIPTLNEARNLPSVLPRIPDWVHEVIIVDGRSTDNTVDVARFLRADVRIVNEPLRGKGAALRRGFAEAQGDLIVMLDADGSMNPEEIIFFIGALMSGADFVKGSRFVLGGGTDDMSLFRMTGNWVLTRSIRMLYGGNFTDLCYGYMAFWAKHLPELESDSRGFEIETVLCIRAIQSRLRIVEVASFERNRIYGESNLRAIPDGWRVLKTIVRERLGFGRST